MRTLLSPSILKPTRSALLVPGLKIATLETCIGASCSTIPPATPACGLGLVCFFTILIPDTISLLLSNTLRTLPRLPLSLPARIITSSSLLIFNISLLSLRWPNLDNFRGQRNNLHKLLTAQLTGYRAKNTRTDRCFLRIQQHSCIVVELDQGAIGTTHAFFGAHHDRCHYLALLDLATGDSFFNGNLDEVPDPRVATL